MSIAPLLDDTWRRQTGAELPVRIIAWDGSSAGPDDAPTVAIRSRDALRRLLWHPGELGAAQAYVTEELDVEGQGVDLAGALAEVRERLDGAFRRRPRARAVLPAVRALMSSGAIGRPPAAPRSQLQVRGRRHTRRRDRAVISHHYDLSNEFYALILDETMSYSSGFWAHGAKADLASAQRAKAALICSKLGLTADMHLLDVGCGWGSLSLHAAEAVGARVTGVTISAEQKEFIEARVAQRGLSDRVTIRLQDYRDLPLAGDFDAVASVEMGEHVGRRNYPTYAQILHDAVRPGGRVVVQQMSRGARHPGGGPFIEAFIAADMDMRPVSQTRDLLQASGLDVLDVEGMREDYVRTVEAWRERFTANRAAIRDLVDEEVVRVWDLYLAGGLLAFRDGRMGVEQFTAVRPERDATR